MTHYPPPPPPRRLYRSRNDRVLGGVCAGIADYLNMDATLVRILTVLITLFAGGVPLVAYVAAWLVMPEQPHPQQQGYPSVAPPRQQPGHPPYPPAGAATDPVWGAMGAPWEQPQGATPPPPRPAERPFPPQPPAPSASELPKQD